MNKHYCLKCNKRRHTVLDFQVKQVNDPIKPYWINERVKVCIKCNYAQTDTSYDPYTGTNITLTQLLRKF